MTKRRSALVLSALLSVATRLTAGNVWNLVWEETGNGAAGTQPSASQWRYDTGGGGWGNGELEYYTNRPENVRYDGAGNLVIEARAESYGGSSYTSGRIQTSATFTQAYGKMEARLKLPVGAGMWPAFWMLGNNIGPVGWPNCGEIDIMEAVPQNPNSYFATLHGPGYSGGGGISGQDNIGSSISAGYHVFAAEWEPGIIRFTLDGTHWLTRTPGDLPGGTTWVYDHPFFLILNLAVGGAWPGPPNGSTVFPQQLLIDYVRVYTRDTSQRPYSGTPAPIAGTIEVENFDDGGPGVAYSDSTTYHPGGVNNYRFSEQPDLAVTNDVGGGYGLGWTVAGEWLEYTVNVAQAGPYAFTARVASQGQGGSFHLQMDGSDLAGSTMTIPDTGGWGSWQDLGPVTVNLPAGTHVLQLHMDTNSAVTAGVGNFNWLKFDSLITPTRTSTPVPPPTATATRTASPLPTLTSTLTRSATPSATPVSSLTSTQTATASVTKTGTATATRTATTASSPSATPTATATRTVTTAITATYTATSTATRTPTTASSPSATPTASRTATVADSATASPTLAGTLTDSPTAASTGTATSTPLPATATLTPDPPTATPVPSSTSTSLPATASMTPVPPPPTPANTATRTATATAIPATASATPTATPSAVPPTASATATGTPTIIFIPPASPVSTGTATPTRTPVSTASATPSATLSSTAQGTAGTTPTGGHCEVRPLTNPQRGPLLRFAVYSDGRQALRLRCYSPAMTVVLDQDLGQQSPGWHRVELPAQDLPSGLYWARLGQDGKPLDKPARVLYLR